MQYFFGKTGFCGVLVPIHGLIAPKSAGNQHPARWRQI